MALGGLAALSDGPASADTPSCPASTFCMWQDHGYGDIGGTSYFYGYASRPHNVWFFVGTGANDQASSFYSNRAWTTAFAKDFNSNPTQGQWACALGHSRVGDLANERWLDGSGMNDSISALYFWTSGGQGGCPQVLG
jgi:hypothetical protein